MRVQTGRKHICAISGFEFLESEMVQINGVWYHPDYIDSDMNEPRKRDSKLSSWYSDYLDAHPSLKAGA